MRTSVPPSRSRPVNARRLRKSGLAILLALMSYLAACQLSNQILSPSTEQQVTPEERLMAAAQRMDDVRTADFAGRGTVDVRLEDGSVSLKTDLAAEGELVLPDRQRATINVETPVRTQSEIIRIGDQLWVRNPGATDWVQQGIDDSQLAQPIDPVQAIMMARVAGKTFTDLGDETIDGARTDHIQVVLDSNGARLLLEAADPALAQHVSSVEGTVDLWIGDDDLVRRVLPDITLHVTDITVSQDQPVGGTIHTRFAADLSNFDQPKSIEPPV